MMYRLKVIVRVCRSLANLVCYTQVRLLLRVLPVMVHLN